MSSGVVCNCFYTILHVFFFSVHNGNKHMCCLIFLLRTTLFSNVFFTIFMFIWKDLIICVAAMYDPKRWLTLLIKYLRHGGQKFYSFSILDDGCRLKRKISSCSTTFIPHQITNYYMYDTKFTRNNIGNTKVCLNWMLMILVFAVGYNLLQTSRRKTLWVYSGVYWVTTWNN